MALTTSGNALILSLVAVCIVGSSLLVAVNRTLVVAGACFSTFMLLAVTADIHVGNSGVGASSLWRCDVMLASGSTHWHPVGHSITTTSRRRAARRFPRWRVTFRCRLFHSAGVLVSNSVLVDVVLVRASRSVETDRRAWLVWQLGVDRRYTNQAGFPIVKEAEPLGDPVRAFQPRSISLRVNDFFLIVQSHTAVVTHWRQQACLWINIDKHRA